MTEQQVPILGQSVIPKEINDILFDDNVIKNIIDWVKSYNDVKNDYFKNNKLSDINRKRKSKNNSCMTIIGNHGIGKTSSIDLILRKLGHVPYFVKFNDIKTCKDPMKYIQNSILSNKILNGFISEYSDQKTQDEKPIDILIFDEIENIVSPPEKKIIVDIQRKNDTMWLCPIIFISDNKHTKLLANLKKSTHEVIIHGLNYGKLINMITNVSQNEKILFCSKEYDDIIEIMMNYINNDMRKLFGLLYELKNTFNEKITSDILEKHLNCCQKDYISADLFKSTASLMYDDNSIHKCIKHYEQEKVILPLMIHQNYPKVVNINVRNDKTKFEVCEIIAESLSKGDVIENYIYSEQNWHLQDLHGFYTCVIPSNELHSSFTNVLNLRKSSLEFPKDLNRTSIKKINKKIIDKNDRLFENMNITDYMYLTKMIKKLINDDKIEECVQILREYKITDTRLEPLLKIDKTKNSKSSLTNKQKLEFKKHLLAVVI